MSRFASTSRDAGVRRLTEGADPIRTNFQRDRDRIIHSTAFRRLQHKTQVIAAYEGDHFRSRMTHSLEVSQMARGVARALHLNHDLAEAIALAHDLGHPPYGHVGEEALHALMVDHGGFRHNAHGARIVDSLEDRHGDGFGLNLTRATRISLLKGKIPAGFPLSPDLVDSPPPPLEARVVDLCDRIAYLCHDLDDGLRAEVLELGDIQELAIWQRATTNLPATAPIASVISQLISILIMDLITTTDPSLESAVTVGEARLAIRHSDEITVLADELLRYLREQFYRSRRVLAEMEEGQSHIRSLYKQFVKNPDSLPASMQARLCQEGIERTVCDYVAGMTDRYLRQLSDG